MIILVFKDVLSSGQWWLTFKWSMINCSLRRRRWLALRPLWQHSGEIILVTWNVNDRCRNYNCQLCLRTEPILKIKYAAHLMRNYNFEWTCKAVWYHSKLPRQLNPNTKAHRRIRSEQFSLLTFSQLISIRISFNIILPHLLGVPNVIFLVSP
jgi:hypothetical protein